MRSGLRRCHRGNIDFNKPQLSQDIHCGNDGLVRRLSICPDKDRQLTIVFDEPRDSRTQCTSLIVHQQLAIYDIAPFFSYGDFQHVHRRRNDIHFGLRLWQTQTDLRFTDEASGHHEKNQEKKDDVYQRRQINFRLFF